MVYIVRYDKKGMTRKEDYARQKMISRTLLDYAFVKEYDIRPDFSKLKRGEHGKPYFDGLNIEYNISNTKGLVCCVLSESEVGIDIEGYRDFNERLIKRVCDESEINQIMRSPNPAFTFIKFWTLKESYLKYTGEGLWGGTKNNVFYYENNKPYKKDGSVFIEQTVLNIDKELYSVSLCSGKKLKLEIEFVKENDLYLYDSPSLSVTEYINYVEDK